METLCTVCNLLSGLHKQIQYLVHILDCLVKRCLAEAIQLRLQGSHGIGIPHDGA